MIWRVLLLAAVLSPAPAFAYIGPGAGISAVGSLVALVGALFLAVVGLIWYPLKRVMRRRKPEAKSPPQDTGNVE
jgi:membrane protein implicated in regulation of membrane protease activity